MAVYLLQRKDCHCLPVIPKLYIDIIYVQGMVTLIEHNQKKSYLIKASHLRYAYEKSNITTDMYFFESILSTHCFWSALWGTYRLVGTD